MGQALEWIVDNAEKIGLVTLLLCLVCVLAYVVRFLYLERQKSEKERKLCEESRLETATEIGEVKGEIKALKTELHLTKEHGLTQIETMRSLHHSVLEVVAAAARNNNQNQ